MARKRPPPRRGTPRAEAAQSAITLAAANASSRHVIYVHGICSHVPGYSDPWWAAMKPFVEGIPDENRHEVLWSDVITPAGRPAFLPDSAEALAVRLAQARLSADPKEAALSVEIRDVLADRAQRQHVHAIVSSAAVARAMSAEPTPAHSFLVAESVAPVAMITLPDFQCINDFAQYLANDSIRDRVLSRFDTVVLPLLQAGARLEVISHSWGTVVAYEALRRMDASATATNGAVDNFFTAGSALAIPPVKRRLRPDAIDGKRPRVVTNWVNLNAHFDIVGGPLGGNPFQVDAEYLDLPPVGCSSIIPNPVCAHGSYFRPANLLVNRDIFGKQVSG